ncbi:unnamed protein product [Adineta ricciae]|uniref:Uncharacterized protein n=1 Tax=Adineta ricciae TaxID=249248 RepID=A0A813NAU3_ADIRI|nr:unnamed protein product [Adineta ricciae]CAF1488161.1 unnamed protein product [Adineta ricciae]
MNNAVNFYPRTYGPPSFPGIPNNYGITSPPVPQFYNARFPHPIPKPEPQPTSPPSQQQQQQQHQSFANHQRPVSQQNNETNNSFKLYDLSTNMQSDIIRLIFSFVGVPYKDKRLKEDEWMKIKEQISFQELPILRVNNQFRIFHLHAIIRYLAREFHLYGTGKHEHAIIDIITEIARQLQDKIFEQNDTSTLAQDQSVQELITDFALNYLKQFEELYTIFDRRGPFYLGTHISLADLIVYNTTNSLIKANTKLLENYTRLKEARRQLEKHPGIANFLKLKQIDANKTHRHRSPHPHRRRTKSPTPHEGSHRHRHRSHRRRSDERRRSSHHHHHHHCPYHQRQRSKEPTASLQSKHQSEKSLQSPSLVTNEKDSITPTVPTSVPPPAPPLPPPPPPLPAAQTKQQVPRASKSPSVIKKDKEQAPPSHTKQRLIRTSISPSLARAEKGSVPPTAEIIPPPPPILKDSKAESKAK